MFKQQKIYILSFLLPQQTATHLVSTGQWTCNWSCALQACVDICIYVPCTFVPSCNPQPSEALSGFKGGGGSRQESHLLPLPELCLLWCHCLLYISKILRLEGTVHVRANLRWWSLGRYYYMWPAAAMAAAMKYDGGRVKKKSGRGGSVLLGHRRFLL